MHYERLISPELYHLVSVVLPQLSQKRLLWRSIVCKRCQLLWGRTFLFSDVRSSPTLLNVAYLRLIVVDTKHLFSFGHYCIVLSRSHFNSLVQSKFIVSCNSSYLFVLFCKVQHEHACCASWAIAEHHHLLASQIDLIIADQRDQSVV